MLLNIDPNPTPLIAGGNQPFLLLERKSQIWRLAKGSTPEVGSSRMMVLLFPTKARRMDSFLFIPPESFLAFSLLNSSNPTLLSHLKPQSPSPQHANTHFIRYTHSVASFLASCQDSPFSTPKNTTWSITLKLKVEGNCNTRCALHSTVPPTHPPTHTHTHTHTHTLAHTHTH